MGKTHLWRGTVASPEATMILAQAMGERLRGGEIITLISDLGGGKTTFVRGLVQGLGSDARVSSPSFTLRNEYVSDRLTLYHFDFYRLTEPGIMRAELAELFGEKEAVIVIEWADSVNNLLPPHVGIRFTPTTETSRDLTISYPEIYAYLMPQATQS